MVAGSEWLRIGTTAALKLSGGEEDLQTLGTELLADIQEVFKEEKADRITTRDLIQRLTSDDEKPWATYNYKGNDKEITPRQLANKLKPYGIRSKTIRFDKGPAKGYEKIDFGEAFSRYVPSLRVTK